MGVGDVTKSGGPTAQVGVDAPALKPGWQAYALKDGQAENETKFWDHVQTRYPQIAGLTDLEKKVVLKNHPELAQAFAQWMLPPSGPRTIDFPPVNDVVMVVTLAPPDLPSASPAVPQQPQATIAKAGASGPPPNVEAQKWGVVTDKLGAAVAEPALKAYGDLSKLVADLRKAGVSPDEVDLLEMAADTLQRKAFQAAGSPSPEDVQLVKDLTVQARGIADGRPALQAAIKSKNPDGIRAAINDMTAIAARKPGEAAPTKGAQKSESARPATGAADVAKVKAGLAHMPDDVLKALDNPALRKAILADKDFITKLTSMPPDVNALTLLKSALPEDSALHGPLQQAIGLLSVGGGLGTLVASVATGIPGLSGLLTQFTTISESAKAMGTALEIPAVRGILESGAPIGAILIGLKNDKIDANLVAKTIDGTLTLTDGVKLLKQVRDASGGELTLDLKSPSMQALLNQLKLPVDAAVLDSIQVGPGDKMTVKAKPGTSVTGNILDYEGSTLPLSELTIDLDKVDEVAGTIESDLSFGDALKAELEMELHPTGNEGFDAFLTVLVKIFGAIPLFFVTLFGSKTLTLTQTEDGVRADASIAGVNVASIAGEGQSAQTVEAKPAEAKPTTVSPELPSPPAATSPGDDAVVNVPAAEMTQFQNANAALPQLEQAGVINKEQSAAIGTAAAAVKNPPTLGQLKALRESLHALDSYAPAKASLAKLDEIIANASAVSKPAVSAPPPAGSPDVAARLDGFTRHFIAASNNDKARWWKGKGSGAANPSSQQFARELRAKAEELKAKGGTPEALEKELDLYARTRYMALTEAPPPPVRMGTTTVEHVRTGTTTVEHIRPGIATGVSGTVNAGSSDDTPGPKLTFEPKSKM